MASPLQTVIVKYRNKMQFQNRVMIFLQEILRFFFFSFYVLQNGERLFIGAPGSWYWQGKITHPTLTLLYNVRIWYIYIYLRLK